MTLSVSVLWVLAGSIFLALEAFGIPGIGFIFAGFAAIIVGIIVETGMIGTESYVMQTAVWFGITVVTAVVLWKPLKTFRIKAESQSSFSNMVGDTATICEGKLERGKIGKARWSGTVMNAELADDAAVMEMAEGDTAIITELKGTTIILKPRN